MIAAYIVHMDLISRPKLGIPRRSPDDPQTIPNLVVKILVPCRRMINAYMEYRDALSQIHVAEEGMGHAAFQDNENNYLRYWFYIVLRAQKYQVRFASFSLFSSFPYFLPSCPVFICLRSLFSSFPIFKRIAQANPHSPDT